MPADLPDLARTNLLSIHLVAEAFPLLTNGQLLRPTSVQLSQIKVLPEPIISDVDLVAWDLTNHSFVITPAAAKRFIKNESYVRGQGEFVLMTSGQPIYLGKFGGMLSSATYIVPVILTDHVLDQCFMGWTNVPLELLRAVYRGEHAAMDRLIALPLPTTNVTLKIDYAYPESLFHKPVPDARDDKRIAASVERLFGRHTR